MSLVRKTENLRTDIHNNLDALIYRKVKALVDDGALIEKAKHLLTVCYHNEVFFPKDFVPTLEKFQAQNAYAAFAIPETKMNFGFSFGRMGTYTGVSDIPVPELLFPPMKKYLLTAYTPSKLTTFGGTLTGNHGTEFFFNMCFPSIEKQQEYPHKATKNVAGKGYFIDNENTFKNEMCVVFEPKNYHPAVIEAWEDLLEMRKAYWEALQKFEHTRDYIFSELWNLRSVNQMIEFFPNLKGLLPDKTVSQYMKGSKKKNEVSIPAPPKSVIGATVEANILGTDSDD